MSQIPRSQFVLKKRQQQSPMVSIPVLDIDNGAKTKKSQSNGSSNGSGNGHKNGAFDNDVVIIEDDGFAVVGHEEVVETVEEIPMEQFSPIKKKRSRKSKDSTESKDSELMKRTDEASKSVSPEKLSRNAQKAVQKEVKQVEVEEPPVVEMTPVQSETRELKVVKMTTDDLIGSKRRSDRLQNASTFVNLSTASNSDSTKNIDNETMETSAVERRVSGRRSTRPIDDIKYSYRSHINDSMNESTNATIGSDFNNDSLLNTPVTDRKRRASGGFTDNIDTPKRSRLNLSGLFSSFSSPVTILRNRFKRTNIASTPIMIGGEPLMNESVEFLEKSASDDFKEVDLNEKEDALTEEKDELKVITTPIKKTSCNVM